MKKIFKRLALGLLSMTLLVAMLGGVMIRKASAFMPPFYEFDTWTSNGGISVRVPNKDYSKFLKLSHSQEEISSTNYTVTADGNDTVITLQKDYLKTLDAGTYTFICYFSGEGEEYQMFGERAFIPEPFGIELPNMTGSYTLKRIAYEGGDLDPAYYTVTMDKGYPRITFQEGATQLGTSFVAYFTAEYVKEYTTLKVDPQAFPPDEAVTSNQLVISTETSAPETSMVSGEAVTSDNSDKSPVLAVSDISTSSTGTVSQEVKSNPQTGSERKDMQVTTGIVVLTVILVSTAGCAVLGITLVKQYKKKKKIQEDE